MPDCDVIIPVYNNANVLPLTLRTLDDQVVPAGWQLQVLLSDDGSTDATAAVARSWQRQSSWPLEIITGPHVGPAGARNRALDMARADIIFFLGADILLRPGVLAAHLDWHDQHPGAAAAALGMITWDPRIAPTPLMEWMIHGGAQNDFDALQGYSTAEGRYFYGSHLSLKRKFIGRERFSLAFGYYGWEDTEFGQRLEKQGLKLHVFPQAVGLHRHYYSVAAMASREYAMGKGVRILEPNYRAWHWRYWLFSKIGGGALLGYVLRLTAPRISTPWLFSIFTGAYFWQGVHDFTVDK